MRTLSLWGLVAAFGMAALAIGTVGVHRTRVFMDRELDPTLVPFATTWNAIRGGLATFVFGTLVKRVSARALGAVRFARLGIASVVTTFAADPLLRFASMAVFGLGILGTIFLRNFIRAVYFGRRHIGSIHGAAIPGNLTVGRIGPPLVGYVYDETGSCGSVWWAGVVLMILSAALLLVTPAPAMDRQSRINPSPANYLCRADVVEAGLGGKHIGGG